MSVSHGTNASNSISRNYWINIPRSPFVYTRSRGQKCWLGAVNKITQCFDGVRAYVFITQRKAWWRYCIGLAIRRSLVWVLSWGSYLHLCASVTKQYNLVPVKGRWRSEAGKVTVGLATLWPCTCHRLFFIHLRAQGRWARLSPHLGTALL